MTNSVNPTDLTDLGQVPGLSPAESASAVAGVPLTGTGLTGFAYAPGDRIWSLERFYEVIAGRNPDAEFTANKLVYASRNSDTSLAEFLAENGSVTSGDGTIEMGPSGLVLKGFVYIPPGKHTITMRTDDGYALKLGGVDISEYVGLRGPEGTTVSADFAGGLYELDLTYFDAGGGMALVMDIDGLPVDQSAFYASVDDFLNPPDNVELMPVEQYHPSHTLGALVLENPESISGTQGNDSIDGSGGDDTVVTGAGDDSILGGYGNDLLNGGDGDDTLDGGYGSDLLIGGAGRDLLVSRSDGGEQKIAQRSVVDETRPAMGYVNPEFDKLFGYEDQPFIGDDILVGGEGEDTFLIAPQINAVLPIIQKHTASDGTIRWNKVAGENDFQHAHWVDLFGFDMIADYNAQEDHIAVIGHTVNVFVEHADYDNDGTTESIITAVSLQHGNGGAHDRDLVGVVFVEGDLVDVEDIKTDNGVTYGVVENYDDVAQAIHQVGETKSVLENGTYHHGYDYRGPGEVTRAPDGSPADLMDNPYFEQAQAYVTGPSAVDPVETTRDPFDQLGFVSAPGQSVTGTSDGELMMQADPDAPDGLPGALGFWSLGDSTTGLYADARGDLEPVKAYTLYENQAQLRQSDVTDGPREGVSALTFNGDDQFAYLTHDDAYEITQGTIALWVRADDLSDDGAIVTKDQRNTGDGGHFRLLQTEDGGLLLRMAPGDGGSNRSWKTSDGILQEGVWAHLAVNFTADGVTVYKDGVAIEDGAWIADEGDVATPGVYKEAYLLRNEEPFVFGADQALTKINDTAQMFATDDEKLDDPFTGAIAEFGIWGGFSSDDALTPQEIAQLMADGPGAALTNPSGPQPMVESDDLFDGAGGNDTIKGGAGDDTLLGGDGDDEIHGGYGDDSIEGGAGNDTIDGGRGSDFVQGGAGDDVMYAGGDVGEDRAGQLVLDSIGVDQPLRPFPDASIDNALFKLVDWTDQPLYADDIFVGGAGRDHMAVRTYINGKKDIILDNVKAGSRDVDWSGNGVAGENNRIHDHWVDGFGIDIFADFNAEEDSISILGHTTNIEVSYDGVDTDGDGVDDSILSLIRAYSQQGKNGGAHDEDELGILAVIGDMVTEDMVETNPAVHFGIVQTIDELQEALAPSDDPSSVVRPDGVFGYDDRDVAGRPLTSDPLAWSVNPYIEEAKAHFAWRTAADLGPVEQINSDPGGSFDGTMSREMAHVSAEQQTDGTYLLSFNAANPGDGNQALLSKDFTNFQDGGHLTIWISSNGQLKVRYQGTDGDVYLHHSTKIEAGRDYDVAFRFDEEAVALYVDGVLSDTDTGFAGGMTGNDNSTFIGASTRRRNENDDRLEWEFEGEISNVAVLDVPIDDFAALLLAENDNDVSVLNAQTLPADDDVPVVDDDQSDDDGGDAQDDPVEYLNIELGSEFVSQSNADEWHSVTFDTEIQDAVVVMGPLERNGGHDAVVRVQNVTSTGFEFQIDEWDYLDAWHTLETVGWMALSAGTHTLANGQTIAAGSVMSAGTQTQSVSVDLSGFETAPGVFAQLASATDDAAATPRIHNINTDGFSLTLQEEEAADGIHTPERLDWVAVDGNLTDVFDFMNLEGGLDHRFKEANFADVSGTPVILAAMQSMNGANTASLRFKNLDQDSVALHVAEERSKDNERWHLNEDVALLTGAEGSYQVEILS